MRLGTSVAIPVVLRELGINPVDVLDAVGLELSLFDDPDNVISYATRNHLVEVCVESTGCGHFGLLIGQRVGLSSLGLVGYLVRHSPDVRSALRSLVGYFHLHAQGAVVALEESGDVVLLSYEIVQPRAEACDQIEDGAVAIMYNAMNSLCGDLWQPKEVLFAHRKPKDREPFRQFFKAPLRFDSEKSGLLFDVNWLRKPVCDADPELHRLLQKQVDAIEAEYDENFLDQVRRVLRSALLTGHTSEEQVAALFSMNSRTFRRRIKDYNTSYLEVADQVRYGIAQQMLENSAADVALIAATLDYSDASSFTRAFKRWSGMTPSTWRDERLAELRDRRNPDLRIEPQ